MKVSEKLKLSQTLIPRIINNFYIASPRPILTSARKHRFNDQMSSWASGKADLAKMQEKSVAEKNSLKITTMKEESATKNKIKDQAHYRNKKCSCG